MEPNDFEAAAQIVRSSPFTWGGMLAVLALIYVTAWAGTRLAIYLASWPLRRYKGDSWTEKARRAWYARRIARVAILTLGLPPMLAFVNPMFGDVFLPRGLLNFIAGMLGITGVLQASIVNERRMNPAVALTPRAALGAWAPPLLVIGPILLVVLLFDGPLPDRMNLTAAAVLISIALGIGIYINWGARTALRGLGIIRPGSDRLCAVVTKVAEKTGVLPRRVEQLGLPMANALAFVLERGIGVTDAALEILDDDQLAAVCAHEMAHLAEPRRVLLARASGAFLLGLVLALLMATARPIHGSFGPSGMLWVFTAACLLLVVGLLLLSRLNRKMEIRADSHATGWEPSPGSYARALELITHVNLIPAVLGSRRNVHPDLYDRMLQAGVTPDFPRPARPPQWAHVLGLVGLLLAASLGLAGSLLVTHTLPDALLDRSSAALWRIGAGRGEFMDLVRILDQTSAP
jgi:Zn-dependent protease with chaperone function